jgi:predicted nucleic acid-binding protein
MRVFLDANILFSAAKGPGAIRQLLSDLHAGGHTLVADVYVAAEAQRNVSVKATAEGMDYLQALLSRIEVLERHSFAPDASLVDWLPEKDRPVLLAAVASRCDALVTGDRTHFGAGFGHTFGGVTLHSPRQLAFVLWGL